jgi:hypothetical protein
MSFGTVPVGGIQPLLVRMSQLAPRFAPVVASEDPDEAAGVDAPRRGRTVGQKQGEFFPVVSRQGGKSRLDSLVAWLPGTTVVQAAVNTADRGGRAFPGDARVFRLADAVLAGRPSDLGAFRVEDGVPGVPVTGVFFGAAHDGPSPPPVGRAEQRTHVGARQHDPGILCVEREGKVCSAHPRTDGAPADRLACPRRDRFAVRVLRRRLRRRHRP